MSRHLAPVLRRVIFFGQSHPGAGLNGKGVRPRPDAGRNRVSGEAPGHGGGGGTGYLDAPVATVPIPKLQRFWCF